MSPQTYFSELIGRAGLINNVYSVALNRSFVPSSIHTQVAKASNLKYLGYNIDSLIVGATSTNIQQTTYALFGELLERMASAKPLPSRLVEASFEELISKKTPALSPTALHLYSKDQYNTPGFPFAEFTNTSKTKWIEGVLLKSRERILVPAFLVYWSLQNEFQLGQSTGLAAGINENSAIQSGLLENLERHDFAIWWYNQNNSDDFIVYDKKIICETYKDDEELVELFDNNNMDIKVIDLGDRSLVETIIVLFFFKYAGKELISIGASSKLNKRDAIVKAGLEAYQTIHIATSRQFKPTTKLQDLAKCEGFELSFQYYNIYPDVRLDSPIFRAISTQKLEKKELIAFKNKPTSLESLISQLNGPVIYVDIEDHLLINDSPYRIGRVITPSYSLLSGNYRYPSLGHPKLAANPNPFVSLPHCFA